MTPEPSSPAASLGAAGGAVLECRLGPPAFAVRLIERPRLIEALNRPREGLVVLEAPPGFGKTALLTQWLAQAVSDEAVWVGLENGDDASSIMAHLCAGFARKGVSAPDEARAQALRPAARLRALLAAVERSGRCFVLVLDGVDRAPATECADIIEPLARSAPDRLRIVLACSGRLPADLSDPDARGLVAWLGQEALRFTSEEVAALCGRGVTAHRQRQIQQRTLGWPLLVRAMASADGAGRPEERRSFDRALDDFVDRRLLAQLDPAARSDCALLSVLERFDEPLAERLLGRRRARAVLDRLLALGLVAAAPADEGMQLAFNPALRDRLRHIAARRRPEALEAFCRRAVDELSLRGKHVAAARLAVDLGDEGLIVRVVEACDPARMMFGEGVGSLRRILRLIPQRLQRSQPRIGYARIICSVKSGHLAEAAELFEALERLVDAAAPRPARLSDQGRLDRQICRLMIATYAGLPMSVEEIEEQRRLAEIRPDLAPMISSTADTLLCYVLQRDGRFEAAKAAARSAILHANDVGSAYAAFFMFCDIAMILGVQGRVEAAFETFHAGERACQAALRQDERLAMIRDVFRLELQHELDPDDMSQAERLRTICRRLPRLEGWPDVFAAAYRTYSEKLAISGDLEAALAVVRTGLDFAAAQRILPLARMLTSQRALLLTWSGRPDAARAALAELDRQARGAGVLSWREQEAMAEARAAFSLGAGSAKAVDELGSALDRARRTGSLRGEARFGVWLHAVDGRAPPPTASPFVRTGRVVALLGDVRPAEARRPSAARDRPQLFTSHERRVLERLGQGLSDKAIGLELGISPHGVRYHLKRIYAQLNVSSRKQAWERARALGLGAPY